MSHKSKKQKHRAKQPKPDRPKSRGPVLEVQPPQRSSLPARLGLVLPAPTLVAGYAIYAYFASGSAVSQPSTWADAVVLAMMLFLAIVLFFLMGLELSTALFKRRVSPKQTARRQLLVLNTATVAATALFSLTLLQQGYLTGISNYLKSTVFPYLSQSVNYVLSNIVTWAVTGAVGNLFYDLLKRLFQRGRDQEKGE